MSWFDRFRSKSKEPGRFDPELLARLDAIAEDDTVAGHVVRLGRARVAAASDDAERAVAERALRIALHALGVR